MPVPSFSSGEVLTAQAMNEVGLWLVKTQTIGTAVSTVTVTSAFSADYENYLITINGGVGSTTGVLRLRLGSVATGYRYWGIYGSWNSSASAGNNGNGVTWWADVGGYTTANINMRVELFGPNLAKTTQMLSQYALPLDSGAGYYQTMGGTLDDANAQTAFTLTTSAGTLTGGTVRVYGFRN